MMMAGPGNTLTVFLRKGQVIEYRHFQWRIHGALKWRLVSEKAVKLRKITRAGLTVDFRAFDIRATFEEIDALFHMRTNSVVLGIPFGLFSRRGRGAAARGRETLEFQGTTLRLSVQRHADAAVPRDSDRIRIMMRRRICRLYGLVPEPAFPG